jgi:hypothetical protein
VLAIVVWMVLCVSDFGVDGVVCYRFWCGWCVLAILLCVSDSVVAGVVC